MPSTYASHNYSVGDKLNLSINMKNFLYTLATVYNNKTSPERPTFNATYHHTVIFYCTIVDFIGDSYGKYGKHNVDSQIIMEYNQFFPWIVDYLPIMLQANPEFVDYLKTPNILE